MRRLSTRGLIHYEQDKFEEALKDLDASIKISDQNPEPFVTRGLVYYESDDVDKAIADFTAALKLDPEDGQALRSQIAGEDDAREQSPRGSLAEGQAAVTSHEPIHAR